MYHLRLQRGADLNKDCLRIDDLTPADIDWITVVDSKGRKSLHCGKRSDFHRNENKDLIRIRSHRRVHLDCQTNATTFSGETLGGVEYRISFSTLRHFRGFTPLTVINFHDSWENGRKTPVECSLLSVKEHVGLNE